jgi:cation diffusion facilitator family transporter
MDSCCENKADELAALRARQSRVLYAVLAINAVMFVVEFVSGWLASSTALLGDSLDMLGDASVYAVTLYALAASERTRAGVAMFKALAMVLFGLVVIVEAVRKALLGIVPDFTLMAVVGSAALLANTVCFGLLWRHRGDDLNMRSTWLCSRNDLVANLSVVGAAGLVAVTGTFWPDLIVGVAIALLFLHSARQVLREALAQWRANPRGSAAASAERPVSTSAREAGRLT